MPKEIYLKIDDSVSKTVAKVSRTAGTDLVLVFPKGAMALSNIINLRLLKKQLDMLGKDVSIMTMDPNAQARIAETGFPVMTYEMLRKGIRPQRPSAPEPVQAAPQPEPEPVYTPPVYQPAVPEPAIVPARQRIFEEPPKKTKQPKIKIHKAGHRRRKAILTGMVLALIILVIAALVFWPSAQITIYAHTQPISRDLQLTVDKGALSADSKNLILPGQVLDKDQQFSKSFSSTGKRDVGIKAEGSVQIYNYTGKTLKFNAATTTFQVGNNIYRLAQDVSGIKPTKNFAGSNDPDPFSLSPAVKIVADQPGDSYNLPAGTRFEIHNQVLGDVPQLLYAKNPQPVDGGVSKFTAIVTQQDLDAARADLQKSIIDSAKQQLLNKSGLLMIDSGAQYQFSDPVFNQRPDDASVSFNGSISGHIKALLFSKAALEDMVSQRIGLTLDRNQTLKDDAAKYDLSFKGVDFDKGTGMLSVKYQGLVVFSVDTNQIEAMARGKTVDELKDLLLSDSRIDGADIDLTPFWAKTLPNLSGRITVQTKVKQP